MGKIYAGKACIRPESGAKRGLSVDYGDGDRFGHCCLSKLIATMPRIRDDAAEQLIDANQANHDLAELD
jgi:hypothetical protein